MRGGVIPARRRSTLAAVGEKPINRLRVAGSTIGTREINRNRIRATCEGRANSFVTGVALACGTLRACLYHRIAHAACAARLACTHITPLDAPQSCSAPRSLIRRLSPSLLVRRAQRNVGGESTRLSRASETPSRRACLAVYVAQRCAFSPPSTGRGQRRSSKCGLIRWEGRRRPAYWRAGPFSCLSVSEPLSPFPPPHLTHATPTTPLHHTTLPACPPCHSLPITLSLAAYL